MQVRGNHLWLCLCLSFCCHCCPRLTPLCVVLLQVRATTTCGLQLQVAPRRGLALHLQKAGSFFSRSTENAPAFP